MLPLACFLAWPAGCHVIAVNAPADTPRLNEVDLVLHSLEQITVTKQPNGDVIIQ